MIRVARRCLIEDKVKLTKQIVSRLEPGANRYYVRDARQPGLTVVVQTSGAKSYYVVKKVRGKVRRVKVGDHPDMSPQDAREAAIKVLSGLNREAPVTRYRDPETLTLGDVWERYYLEHVPTLRPGNNAESNWRIHVSALKDRPLSSIRRSDIVGLMADVEARVREADPDKTGYRAANGARALVGKMWRKALLWDLTEYPNPVPDVPRRPSGERERYLLEAEMRRFLVAVGECENRVVRDAVLLMLYTAARKSNVLAMEWDEIDFTERLWTIPAAKYKGKRIHHVPLVESALGILRTRHETRDPHLDRVFPARWGSKGYVTNIHTAGWCEIVDAAGLDDFTPHDIRHTASTWAINEDESDGPVITEEMVGAWIGHKRKTMTGLYAKVSLKLARKAAEAAEVAINRVRDR